MKKLIALLALSGTVWAAPSFDNELKYQDGIDRVKKAAVAGVLEPKDATEILALFKAAADGGHSASQSWVAAMQLQLGNASDAFKNASEAAVRNGDAQSGVLAYTLLGMCYYEGIGTEKNSKAAFDCLMKAANRGGGFAASRLGVMYAKGIGTDSDEGLALRWHQRGTEPLSREFLGDDALKHNDAEAAAKLYREAGFGGDVNAMVKYVKISLVGATRNVDEAIYYSQVAKLLGSDEAAQLLKTMAADGLSESTTSIHRFANVSPQAEADAIKRSDNEIKFLLRNSEVRWPDDRMQ